MNIGKEIKRLRKSTGIKQKKFAKQVDLSPVHYCSIENGRNMPTLELLEKISVLTNTELIITFIDKK